jgi:amino-acid N-acetyltransferase
MHPDPTIRPAQTEDLPGLEALLSGAHLPLDGFREHLAHALVAVDDGRPVGCVALEPYGECGLLRSLVVAPEHRGKGLGERLTAEALRLAEARGIRDIYLLTETAAGFFPRFGFRHQDRSGAPPALSESAEFRTACCPSAVMMHRKTGVE